MTDLRLIYVTAGSREEAVNLARVLVQERLVACANVVDRAISVFSWQGEVQEESEALLFAKTRAENMPALTERLKEIHSYSVPCIVAMPLMEGEGNQDFLDWVAAESTP